MWKEQGGKKHEACGQVKHNEGQRDDEELSFKSISSHGTTEEGKGIKKARAFV